MCALLILVVSHFDQELIAPFYDPLRRDFPLRHAWAFAVLGHTGLKWLMLAFWVLCIASGGAVCRGAVCMAVIAAVVVALRHYSPVTCPWDLLEYGGQNPDTGRCMPAAHPITGFALFGLYAALRGEQPRAARYTLAAAWLIGLLAGAVQVARGAHFPSHVLWTAWVAWAVSLALIRVGRPRAAARS